MKLLTNGENLVKFAHTQTALLGVYIPKFWQKFSVLGPHTPTPAPIGVKFGVE